MAIDGNFTHTLTVTRINQAEGSDPEEVPMTMNYSREGSNLYTQSESWLTQYVFFGNSEDTTPYGWMSTDQPAPDETHHYSVIALGEASIDGSFNKKGTDSIPTFLNTNFAYPDGGHPIPANKFSALMSQPGLLLNESDVVSNRLILYNTVTGQEISQAGLLTFTDNSSFIIITHLFVSTFIV